MGKDKVSAGGNEENYREKEISKLEVEAQEEKSRIETEAKKLKDEADLKVLKEKERQERIRESQLKEKVKAALTPFAAEGDSVIIAKAKHWLEAQPDNHLYASEVLDNVCGWVREGVI